MTELTEEQVKELENQESAPPRIVNPRTKETFVLLRADEYNRLKENEYDDSPWTREEIDALAWETGKEAGWDEMDEYDYADAVAQVLGSVSPAMQRRLNDCLKAALALPQVSRSQ